MLGFPFAQAEGKRQSAPMLSGIRLGVQRYPAHDGFSGI